MSGGIARVVLAAAVSAAALAGCSGGDDVATPLGSEAAGAPDPTTAAATTTPRGSGLPATQVTFRPVGKPAAADQAVLEAYRKFWQALATAYTTGDVSALRATTGDPATSEYLKVADGLRKERRTLQGPVSLAPFVVGRGDVVTLADCADLREFRTYDAAGKALFPKDKALTSAEVRLRKVGGSWRVTSFDGRPSGCRQQGG